MAADGGAFWHLLCSFRQQAKSAEVVDLARALGGGRMTPGAQEALLERCVRDEVCARFPPGDAYVGTVLKKAVLAAERDGEEVTDGLVEEHTRLMMLSPAAAPGGGLGDDGGQPRWVYKTFAYREEAVGDGAGGAGGPAEGDVRLLTLRTSPNMLEGGTGCHEWQAGFRLAEAVLTRPGLVRGRSVLELGCGTGALGVVVARLGARRVILTDGDEQTLANLRHNLATNGVGVEGPAMEVSTLEWEAHARGEQALPNDADVVLGADLIYDPGSIAPLVEVLGSLLRPRGTAAEALIANALRNEDTLRAFARAGRDAGFGVEDVTEELGGEGRFAHHSVLVRERIHIHRFTPAP